MRRWIVRLAAIGLGVPIVLIALGLGYQSLATWYGAQRFTPPGQWIEIAGGRRLHVLCAGRGSPTVVLESALDASSLNWAWIQPRVATVTKTCAYDRAGFGWSDSDGAPRDAARIASDLHALLGAAGIPPPYVLVGHSLGGLYVRAFTGTHPDEVAGIVLIEATHPDLWQRLPPALASLPSESELKTLSGLARLGIARLGWVNPFPASPDLPIEVRGAARSLAASTPTMDAIVAELRALPKTLDQVRAAGAFGDVPLLVLTAENTYPQQPLDIAEPAEREWRELQKELFDLSTSPIRSRRLIAGSDHESIVYARPYAGATANAIIEFVAGIGVVRAPRLAENCDAQRRMRAVAQ